MSWKDDYLEKYKKLKAEGKSFFPYAVFKDTLVALLILIALCALAQKFGAELQDPADPTDSNYNPRPEWYFLFLFQALKLFPGNLEALAGFVLPTLGVVFLFLVPFLDGGPERHPFKRPFFTLMGMGTLAGIGYLTYQGIVSPLTNPIIEKDPLAMEGRQLYINLKCAYCHKIGGKGGKLGPELDKVAGGETEEWLTKHFKEPRSLVPDSAMPKLNLMDDEIKALVTYMKSLGANQLYTDEAVKAFSENCAACHKIGSDGGDVGPDLSLIGSARDKNYIKMYMKDPSKLNPSSTMPGYQSLLTETQMEDLARYLSQQK